MLSLMRAIVLLVFCFLDADAKKTAQDMAKRLGADLLCSGCSWTIDIWRRQLITKIKKNMTEPEKREKIEAMMETNCDKIPWPKKLCTVGDDGERKFEDQEKQMETPFHVKAGVIMNQMGMEVQEAAWAVCKWTKQQIRFKFIEKALTTKERLGDINWEYWACVKTLKICKNTQLQAYNDDDEDDDSDL
mmetsp:Transcript_128933/g.223642  ORF Transcript_128933/g.223642 Transcript_128933/m.223642 type:complete len:189 (+) Transcript_128933:38-604(+)